MLSQGEARAAMPDLRWQLRRDGAGNLSASRPMVLLSRPSASDIHIYRDGYNFEGGRKPLYAAILHFAVDEFPGYIETLSAEVATFG